MRQIMTSKNTAKNTAKILTANDLLSGLSVFLSKTGAWTTNPREARLAHDAKAEASLADAGKAAADANKVIGAYLVEVRVAADGSHEPIHYRERLRASAQPSFWRPQPSSAKSAARSNPEEARHVSV
jgi:hypothetical protein